MSRKAVRSVLAENLDRLIKASGMTKKQVSEKSGVQVRMIDHYLSGTKQAGIESVEALGRALGASGALLLTEGVSTSTKDNARLLSLIQNYLACPEDAREFVAGVARRETKRPTRRTGAPVSITTESHGDEVV